MPTNRIITNDELIEQFPDKEYRLEEATKKDIIFLMTLKGVYGEKDLIPFSKIRKDVESGSLPHGPKFWNTASRSLRRLWRAGHIRRFVAGKWMGYSKYPKTGKWWGVHYIMSNSQNSSSKLDR